ncbi:MAG: Glu-tRNA(Gln) amidotransferase subunit GatE [Candidatus Aegiribacteria sp.]|nr:Glu-tRNA(Gln) amidotransferase subunit GatE [Candidatus Aegiribacteria sp.]
MTGIRKMEDMTASDYEEIGLRSGLEIHQQLDTEKKLFCRCPVLPYSQSFDAEILRHMRPTLSELGEYDGTALMEFKTRKEIIYRINKDTVCTYEMDDTPPFELNLQALDIALEITMLLHCKLISELHIQRKQYLDGSIPAGFQRTTILGVDGWIPYGDRRIGIIQLGLEEDACREVSDRGHDRVYLTDRLGIPLIETVTAPEMVTPYEVAEVAVILSNLARVSSRVRRGIGAARQDVNVSVRGGQRVEIKGVSRIPTIPLLVHNEAFRQVMLLSIKSELKKRGITDSSFESSSFNITETLADTQYEPAAEAIKNGLELHAVVLRGYRGILSTDTQPGQTFASEISDRVRVIACLDRLPNITHSDSGGESFSYTEWERIKKSTGAFLNDSVVVVWGTGQDIPTAVSEISIRAREAIDGVCNETRQSFPDGTNGFERILPGPNRMYPDTDLPPLAISVDHMERISSALPERPWERKERYIAAGVPEESARQMSISMLRDLFDRAVKETPYPSGVLMHFFLSTLSHLKKRGIAPDLSDDVLILSLAEAGRRSFTIDAVAHILENTRGSEFKDISLVADEIEMPEMKTLGKAVEQILSGIESSEIEQDILKRIIFGRIRQRFNGLINGKEVSELVHSMVLQERNT